jgi:hypothetical protein
MSGSGDGVSGRKFPSFLLQQLNLDPKTPEGVIDERKERIK